jgi:phage tail sheath protein FI
MPVTPTYPGVYIEEIPSGVRTITGVATSITAFLGRAARGPVNDPVKINSFADYQRRFGGLAADSTMSYAVQQFYLNGGSQAIIVRLTTSSASPATISLAAGGSPGGTLDLEAANPGEWGNNLSVAVDHETEPQDDVTFNLTVRETVNGKNAATEIFRNVSVDPRSARFLPRVLAKSSLLIAVSTDNNGQPLVPLNAPLPTPSIGSGSPPLASPPVGQAFGRSDGGALAITEYRGDEDRREGMFALNDADLFNLLCIPPPTRGGDTPAALWREAAAYCRDRRAILLVDPQVDWGARPETAVSNTLSALSGLPAGEDARNAALYFPLVQTPDPLRQDQLDFFAPCGMVAGIIARTDSQRGVFKAPAGIDATLNGSSGLQVNLTDPQNGDLNQRAVNCLRTFPIFNNVVWGSRTLRGADQAADEYKYLPVRRLALFIEESLFRGTQWVVFEPNDEPLWSQIRLNVGAFMQDLFLKGAFQGRTPREAYLVKVDKETTTQIDIDRGIVNILVGFAPLKPAEFVIIQIQQLAGQTAV